MTTMTTNEATSLWQNNIIGFAKYHQINGGKKEIMAFLEKEIESYKNEQILNDTIIHHVQKLIEFYIACKTLLDEEENKQKQYKEKLNQLLTNFEKIK